MNWILIQYNTFKLARRRNIFASMEISFVYIMCLHWKEVDFFHIRKGPILWFPRYREIIKSTTGYLDYYPTTKQCNDNKISKYTFIWCSEDFRTDRANTPRHPAERQTFCRPVVRENVLFRQNSTKMFIRKWYNILYAQWLYSTYIYIGTM